MSTMLYVLRRLAALLFRLRAVLWVIGSVGAVAFVASAAIGNAPGGTGLIGLIAVVWSGYLLAVAHFFVGSATTEAPATGLRARLRRALGEVLVRVTAVALLGLGGVVLAFTFKAISASR